MVHDGDFNARLGRTFLLRYMLLFNLFTSRDFHAIVSTSKIKAVFASLQFFTRVLNVASLNHTCETTASA
jgi:hypothetical protein